MPNKELTERENEIMDLVADGLDRQQMCDTLGITTSTLGSHEKNIHFKLGTSNMRQLIVLAIKMGFGKKN